MPIQILAVGGYGEVGKNMTAVQVDDDIVIFDMGLHLPNYIKYTEEELGEVVRLSAEELRNARAIPDDRTLQKLTGKVVAIVAGHAHLDHIGAIPYLAAKYDVPIICTPYTAAVLRAILKDERIKLPNKIIELEPDTSMKLSKKVELEFINITHSVPQSVISMLSTRHGRIAYTCDFKLDNSPTIGKKPSYEALRKAGKEGVLVAIFDSLYAHEHRKTPSEAVARELLKDVLLGIDSRGKAIVITTFSSHIARLKAIVELARKLGRKPVFLGRSLAKYVFAAEEVGLVRFSDEVEIAKYAAQTRKKLLHVVKMGKEKYLLVVTGHQGEPKSTLAKMVRGALPFKWTQGDFVIFSSNVIPAQPNLTYRKQIEDELKALGVRVFTNVHVSGHAAREDMRDLIGLLKPEHLIPAHCEPRGLSAFIELAKEMGYEADKTVHILKLG
ncbi:MAG: RNase J family beta-CASP ribonuclease, partial [Candidatus Woesearchaeota archaeon]